MTTGVLSELFGQYRARILELLFLHPGESFHLRGIAAKTGVPPASLHSMLPTLFNLGLVRTAAGSGGKRYQANTDLPGAGDLTRLLAQYSLPVNRLRETIGALSAISAAAVIGSYAAGTARVDSDIDVLVVGEITRIAAQAAVSSLSREIGRPISATVLSKEEFQRQASKDGSFVSVLMSQPIIPLKGDLRAAAAA